MDFGLKIRKGKKKKNESVVMEGNALFVQCSKNVKGDTSVQVIILHDYRSNCNTMTTLTEAQCWRTEMNLHLPCSWILGTVTRQRELKVSSVSSQVNFIFCRRKLQSFPADQVLRLPFLLL